MNLFLLLICLIFSHPGFSQDAEETEIELMEAQRAQKAKFQKIAETTANSALEMDPAKQLGQVSLFDEKLHTQLKQTFEAAKLWEKRPEDVRKMIEDGSRGKVAEKVFKQFPKLLDFATDILRDKEAMPKLVQMLGKKQQLKQYFFVWLVLLIGSWLIKKNFFPPEPNFMRRLMVKLIFSIGTSAVSLFLFYGFFKEELDPTLRIFIRHFL